MEDATKNMLALARKHGGADVRGWDNTISFSIEELASYTEAIKTQVGQERATPQSSVQGKTEGSPP